MPLKLETNQTQTQMLENRPLTLYIMDISEKSHFPLFSFDLRSILNTFPPPELPHFLLGSHIVVAALWLGAQLVGAPFACVA